MLAFDSTIFTDILENNDYNICIQGVCDGEPLVKHLKQYAKKCQSTTHIVSLSGGVDSMVIATILKYLGYRVICVHINYNNRTESHLEADFLHSWTEFNNITFFRKDIEDMKRGEINRKVYEDVTREIRFNLYKVVLTQYDGESVILGHHDDDIIENVFNNMCRGRDLLDLTVMRKESTMSGVVLSRPLLGQRKKMVYDFAHKYKVPYFKDTTPLWSLRGTFRHNLYPTLERMYSGVYENLLSISGQSDQWGEMIRKQIIQPYLDTMVFDENRIQMDISKHRESPLCFWRHILSILFHKYEKAAPSLKSVQNFVKILCQSCSRIQLTLSVMATIRENTMTIQFL